MNLVSYSTRASFVEENNPSVFKSRDFLISLKKRKMIYTIEDFIKMCQANTVDFLTQAIVNKTRFFCNR